MRTRTWFLGATFLVAAVGCYSTHSTLVSRNEANTRWEKKPLRGVPITLQVPTHLAIKVTEIRYATKGGEVLSQEKAPYSRDVKWEILKTDKIFTVDLERPAAGPMKYVMDFNGQYFSKIQGELTDETIQRLFEGIEKVLGKVAPSGLIAAPTSAVEAAKEAGFVPLESVVAYEVLELDDPALERNIKCFLDTHVNLAGKTGMVTATAKPTTVTLAAGSVPASPGSTSASKPALKATKPETKVSK